MSNIYTRHEELCDRREDLIDLIGEIKHLLTIGFVQGDADERGLYEDKLDEYTRRLEQTDEELEEVQYRIEAIERADFERMTL